MSAFRGAFPAMAGNMKRSKTAQKPSTQQMIQKALMKFESRTRELKFVNGNTIANYATAGATAAMTNNIQQGDSSGSRDGSSVHVVELDYTWISYSHASATIGDAVRLIFYVDTQNAGVTPAVTEILNTATVSSPYALGVFITKRFRILKDITLPLGIAGASNSTVVRKGTVKLNNHHVQFLASTGAATDNGPGSIWFLVISDNGTNVSNYDFNVMVKYFDS